MSRSKEKSDCRICGAPSIYTILWAGEFEILRCRSCGVFYYWPLPALEALDDIYNKEWESESGRHCHFYCDPESEKLNLEKNFRPRLTLLDTLNYSGRILDIGCSVGTFLEEAKRRGWSPEGIDLGREACAKTQERVGCPVHHGSIESAGLPHGVYDVIHASQVYEHVLDPDGFLQAARELLRSGGALLLATPIIDPVIVAISNAIQTKLIPAVSRGRMNGYPWGLYPPYHIFVQSTHSLFLLLERNGFQVVTYKKFPWIGWYTMNLKWRVYYHSMNLLFRAVNSGQNIDVVATRV